MRRFLLMLVICVSSFMIYTNNVNAKDDRVNFNIDALRVNESNSSFTRNLPVTNFSQLGINFYGLSTRNDNSYSDKYFRFYLSGFDNLESNKSYRVSFLLYDTNEGLPMVFSSSTACNVSNSESMIRALMVGGSQNYVSTEYLYAVTCPNWNKTTPNIYVYHGRNDLDNIAYKYLNPIGIINDFHYVLTDTDYFIMINDNFSSLKSNTQAISNNTEQIKNDIKSENVSGAESSADDLKNNSAFQDNTGLSGVISMPLTFVNSLTNTCQPINLNIPYMDVDVTIPCMQSVITDKMPLLANLIKIIVNGFIVYRILLDIFQIVRNAKNPEDDRIEVLDL